MRQTWVGRYAASLLRQEGWGGGEEVLVGLGTRGGDGGDSAAGVGALHKCACRVNEGGVRSSSYAFPLQRITTWLVAGIVPAKTVSLQASSPVHSIRQGPVGLLHSIPPLHASLPVHLMRHPLESTHLYPLLPVIVLRMGGPTTAWVVGK